MKKIFNNIVGKKGILMLILCIGWAINISAQTDSLITQNGLSAHFVKYKSNHIVGSFLYFNSLHITNVSTEAITFKPEFEIPEGWTVPKFMIVPESVTLEPNEERYIPIKMNIPSLTEGDATYHIKSKLTVEGGSLDVAASIYVPIKRNWTMKVLKEEVILLPKDSSSIRFETRFQNLGNTKEVISLQLQVEDKFESRTIELPPGFDSIFFFDAEYEGRVRTEGAEKQYVRLMAETNDYFEAEDITFVKFDNKYDGGNVQLRPNTLGTGIDNFRNFRSSRMSVNANGSVNLHKGRHFVYTLTNTDLLNYRQAIRFSDVTAQYLSPKFDIGVGNLLSLGEEIHDINVNSGRNATLNGFNIFNVKYKHNYNPTQQTQVYFSRNINTPITTVGLGHRARFDETVLQSFLTYTLDYFGRKSTKIGAFSFESPLSPTQKIGINTSLASETHHLHSLGRELLPELGKDPFSYSGFNYQFFYSGLFFDRLHVNTFQGYSSPRYASRQAGFFYTNTQIRYTFPNTHYFTLNLNSSTQGKKTYSNGLEINGFLNTNNNLELLYNLPLNRYFYLKGGGYLQGYKAERPSDLTNEIYDYYSGMYGIRVGLDINLFNHNLSLESYYSNTTVNNFISPTSGISFMNIDATPSTFIVFSYGTRNITFGSYYRKGPNTTLSNYEFAESSLDREVYASYININKYLFKQRLLFTVNSSYRHDLDRDRVNVSINPALHIHITRGWGVYGRGVINYLLQSTKAGVQESSVSYANFGIQKSFDVVTNMKFHNFRVVCYIDANDNGKYDEGEKGVPDIQLEIDPIALGKKRDYKFDKLRYRKVMLFSDEKGGMLFKKLPEGRHNIFIRKVGKNANRYVSKISSAHHIELNSDQVLHIPFGKAKIVRGQITITKDKYSRKGKALNPAYIRVTATSPSGEEYHTLSNGDGSYELSLPESEFYMVTINNPFPNDVKLLENERKVDFKDVEEAKVDFHFKQKQRKINFD